MLVRFTLNGVAQQADVSGGENVRELLQKTFHIHSVRPGDDNTGYSGNDTILLNGRPALAGLLLAGQLEGKDVRTVESLAAPGELSPVQRAMIDAGAVQDGYNAPAAALLLTELLERCPEPDRDQVRDALAGLMVRDCGYEPFFRAVELVVKRRANPKTRLAAAPNFCPQWREIGTVRPKGDAAGMVTGQPVFTEDRVQPGALHLHMLRSPHAHARIIALHVDEALAMPGVARILTHENTPDIYYTSAGQGAPEPSPHDRRLFTPKVRHVGDRVAAVLAATPAQAQAAAARIRVEYEVLPAVFSVDDAAAEGAPVIHAGCVSYGAGAPPDLAARNRKACAADGRVHYPFPIGADAQRNLAASVRGQLGDMRDGFADADVIIERRYASSQIQCTPPETHTCYARMEGERLVVHASTQVPFHVRRVVARICGLPQNRVHVIKERVGGGYGSKQDILLEDVTAYAAWVTRRPVFCQYSRREEFTACSTRHVMDAVVKLGAKHDGTLTAMEMHVRANTGPYGSHCLTVPMNAASKTLPLFLCPNVSFDIAIYYSNIPPTGAYQGYGAPQGSFALQTALAELAHELGMEHAELLRRNMVRQGDHIELLRILGEGREGVPATVESCGLHEALEQGLASMRKKARAPGPHWKVGRGYAVIQQGSGLPGIDQANARVALCSDGSLLVQQGGADIGTGLDTAMAKIAAEIMAVPLDAVQVISGDTDATPFDTGAYASSGTYFSGNAVLRAARQLHERVLAAAGQMLEVDPAELTLKYPGVVEHAATGASLTLAALAHQAEQGHGPLACGPLVGSGCFVTEKHAIPYGAHFCQVAVNTRTGAVKVLRYHALHDSGTPVNPELALGQVYGGVLKSLGHALWEEMVLDETGRCVNPTLQAYGTPGIWDAPDDFRVTLIPTDDPNGPFGAKSISEIATNGAAPALAAAIHDAVGVWMRTWPFTPEKILRAMGKIREPGGKRRS